MNNPETRNIIEAELQPGEVLLWADRPTKRPYTWRGVYRALFWCFWMGFADFFTFSTFYGALIEPKAMTIIFPIIGGCFLAFGWITRKPMLKAFFGPKYEIYGLTDRRAIILSPLWKDSKAFEWLSWGHDHFRQSIPGKDLDIIKTSINSGEDVGTIVFAAWWDQVRYKRFITPHPEHSPKLMANLNGFRKIRNPALVAELIKERFGATKERDSETARTVQEAVAEQAVLLNTTTKIQDADKIKHRRILLFSIFPIIWIVYTLLPIAIVWKLISFFTFPYFVVFTVYAIREAIRPIYTYRT